MARTALGAPTPRKMAQTPFAEAATSTEPSEHSPAAKRLVRPLPPLRKQSAASCRAFGQIWRKSGRGDSRSAPSTFDVRSPVHRLRDLRQGRIMQLWTESVELLEAHDERPPLVRVDPVVLPVH